MSSFTDYLENKILGHVFGGTPYVAPSTIYVALFTSETTDDGMGNEVNGGAYVRMPVALIVTENVVSNTDIVEWPTATGFWGTVTHGALFDAPTGGNMLAQAPLTAARVIEEGDVFRLPVGDLIVTLD